MDWEDIRQIVHICALDPSDESFRSLICDVVEKMDSRESKNLSDKREPLAPDLKLPVFDKPQIEPWPVKMLWAAAMRHLAPTRSPFRQGFDFAGKAVARKKPRAVCIALIGFYPAVMA